MTCIVAIKDDDKIVMAGDRSCDYGYYLDSMNEPKIISYEMSNYKMLIGYAGTMKGFTLLKHALVLPEWDGECPIDGYVSIDLMDSIRECWDEHNFTLDGEQNVCEFLIAIHADNRLHLFNAGTDLTVTSSVHPYSSVGTGAVFALGVLCGLELTPINSEDKARLAMRSAETWCNTVQGPFDIAILGKDGSIAFSS